MAQERAQQSHGARLSEQVWRYVVEKLHATWSPEQIGAVGEREGIRISHARIYQYIKADAKAGGQLFRQLRCQKKYAANSTAAASSGAARSPIKCQLICAPTWSLSANALAISRLIL